MKTCVRNMQLTHRYSRAILNLILNRNKSGKFTLQIETWDCVNKEFFFDKGKAYARFDELLEKAFAEGYSG